MNVLEKIKIHEKWFKRSEEMVARELVYLDEDLSSDSLEGFNSASYSLGRLASYYGVRGGLSVHSGDVSGWNDIGLSINYRYWDLMLKSKVYTSTSFLHGVVKGATLTNQLSSAACLLAALKAVGDEGLSSSVASVLEIMLTKPGVIEPSYLSARRFEPFMMWLNLVSTGNKSSEFIKGFSGLGVYGEVINKWDSAELPDILIEKLYNYHFSNFEDKGGSWDPEFKYEPFDLLPFEVAAIYAARKELTPDKLKNSPFPLDGILNCSITTDELLSRVESAYFVFF